MNLQQRNHSLQTNKIWNRLNLSKLFDNQQYRTVPAQQKQNTIKFVQNKKKGRNYNFDRSARGGSFEKMFKFNMEINNKFQTLSILQGSVKTDKNKSLPCSVKRIQPDRRKQKKKLVIEEIVNNSMVYQQLFSKIKVQQSLRPEESNQRQKFHIQNRDNCFQRNKIQQIPQQTHNISTEYNQYKYLAHSLPMTPYMRKKMKRKTEKYTKTKNNQQLPPKQEMFKFTETKPIHEINPKKNNSFASEHNITSKTRNAFTTSHQPFCRGRVYEAISFRDREIRPWSGDRKAGVEEQF